MNPLYYRIDITNPEASPGTSDGFVDHTPLRVYSTQPANLVNAKAKARGNLRWKEIIQHLSLMANVEVTQMNALNANQDSEANVFSFTAIFRSVETLITDDEFNAGQFVIEEYAIKRVGSRALMAEYSHNVSIAYLVDEAPVFETTLTVSVTKAANTLEDMEDLVTVVPIEFT